MGVISLFIVAHSIIGESGTGELNIDDGRIYYFSYSDSHVYGFIYFLFFFLVVCSCSLSYYYYSFDTNRLLSLLLKHALEYSNMRIGYEPKSISHR